MKDREDLDDFKDSSFPICHLSRCDAHDPYLITLCGTQRSNAS